MIEHYQRILREVYGGRRWIVAMDVLAAMRGLVDRLGALAVESVLCVAASRGAGELPDPAVAPNPIVFDVRADGIMSGIRASMHQLADLPPEASTRIDEFDPDASVEVIGTIFDDGSPVGGRRKYGGRPPQWRALEDKTTIDALWDRIGVTRSEARVLPVDDLDRLAETARELDLGVGTVWVADNREGFHGGATYARHVRSDLDVEEVGEFLAANADCVRVMPFLEGIPCSIHGFVFAEKTIALRPCEMLVFRREGTTEFHYGKAATFWDPLPEDRKRLRAIARRVGDHLRERYDYRGAFTVDGVMTRDGFRPTELNPRFGAALGVMTRALDLDLMLLNLAIVEREPHDWRPDELEALLLNTADEHRAGGTMAVSPTEVEETVSGELVFEGGEFRRVGEGEPADANYTLGPHSAGSFLSVDFVPARTPVGRSVASRAAAALRWANAEHALCLGRLVGQRDVRAKR